ncbi:MAG: adenylyltransferase/cytidyltransferase family protein [Patescibacteria group bacterium]
MNPRTALIFGVFDGIHDGHRAFISEAKLQGERLVAVVARDSVVNTLKGKPPLHNEADRIKSLLEVPDIDLVFLGDLEEGTYNIVKEIKPDIIYLGYDQQALFDNISKAISDGILPEIELVYGKAHKGDTLHSSILNESRN